jgi:hypothetical protein
MASVAHTPQQPAKSRPVIADTATAQFGVFVG